MSSIVDAPFALIKKHKTLADSDVEINPDYLGEIEARAGEHLAGLVTLARCLVKPALSLMYLMHRSVITGAQGCMTQVVVV